MQCAHGLGTLIKLLSKPVIKNRLSKTQVTGHYPETLDACLVGDVMEFSVQSANPAKAETACLVLPVFKGSDL